MTEMDKALADKIHPYHLMAYFHALFTIYYVKITFGETGWQLAEFFRGRTRLFVESDRHFSVEECLVVQHGDGLHCLHGMVELDHGVAAGLAVFVAVQLCRYHSPSKTEYFSQFLLINRVGQLQQNWIVYSQFINCSLFVRLRWQQKACCARSRRFPKTRGTEGTGRMCWCRTSLRLPTSRRPSNGLCRGRHDHGLCRVLRDH